jgi:hypothetical protein
MMRVVGRAKRMIRRMRVLGFARVALLVETFGLLLAARLALSVLPVQRVLAWNNQGKTPPADAVDIPAQLVLVRWLIVTVSRRSILEFVCFPQSLAARFLLDRRGIDNRLYYGVNRKNGKLEMHTWIEAGGEIVVGGEEAGDFSVIAVY